jgi:hypothetical protein
MFKFRWISLDWHDRIGLVHRHPDNNINMTSTSTSSWGMQGRSDVEGLLTTSAAA